MSNTSEDIQAVGSDTHPLMLDRTDYESWAQHIRLYYRGKENRHHILSFIDEGPFKMGICRDAIGATPKGPAILGPKRPRTYDDLDDNNKAPKAIWDNVKMLLEGSELTKEDRESLVYDEFERFRMLPVSLLAQSFRAYLPHNNNQLRTSSNTRNQAIVQNGRVVVQTVQGRQNQRNNAWGAGAAANGGVQNRAGNANQENGAMLDEEEILFLAGDHANTFDADVDEQPVRDMAQNDDNILQADECDAFDSDMDDESTAQTIFMANLSSAGLAHQQVGPSHASTLSEVQNLDNDVDHVDVNHKEHEIHNEVQQPIVVDSDTIEMGNSNIIPYEQYLKNNEAFVVLNDVSSVLNDDSLATELAIYKEQVEAKRAQPALYDGHEILKTNHVPAIVPTLEEDLELADISKEKMIKKVKDPEVLTLFKGGNILLKPVVSFDVLILEGSSQTNIDDKGYWDSGCSRHMTCNISYLFDFEACLLVKEDARLQAREPLKPIQNVLC
nr:hypothetical protein [Tanacetum cinerariifolium]